MVGLFNSLIKSIGAVIGFFLNLLPDSPFQWALSGDFGIIGWVFPVAGAVAHLEAFVFAVAIYYGLRIILRWAKAAGG